MKKLIMSLFGAALCGCATFESAPDPVIAADGTQLYRIPGVEAIDIPSGLSDKAVLDVVERIVGANNDGARQNRWKSDGEWKAVAASLVGRSWSAEGVTVTFGVNGVVAAKLKVGSNTFTGSATLNCPGGVLYIYFAPNTKKKFKGAVKVISVDPDVVP